MKNIYGKILLVSSFFLTQGSITAQCASPVNLGSASNMVGLIRNNSSAIAANKALNTISFIHRNNVTTFGGNSGHLRFDFSTNGGTTWTNDQGLLNPVTTNPGRYPNIAIYNPVANTNTANAYMSYMAPTIDGALAVFNGIVTGVSHFNATGVTESYNQNGIGTTMLPGSLVTGAPGVFWSVEPLLAGNGFNVYKGVWNSTASDIVWNINYTAMPTIINLPTTVWQDYNIAFDPTGMTGYFSFTGHVSPGPSDASLYPVLYRTTDGGITWTGPITVDVGKFSCITTNVTSPNFAAINNGHDLVVDVNGNPHFITTMGSSNSTFYTFNYNAWHHMYDITLKNGLWVAYDLGNVNCAEYTVGAGLTTFPVSQAAQAARSADGTKIFFTWTDNSGSSLGSPNSTPDLFGKAYNVTNDTWTPTKNFTSCNPALAGKMLFPHIAAEVLEPNASTYLVPAMFGSPSVTNDLDQQANFKYLDNITFSVPEFSLSVPPATVTIQQAPTVLVCSGSSLTINVAGNAGQAIWNTGATTTSLSITSGTATSYSVVAQVGCNVGSATVAVTNLTLNASTVNSSICPGAPANFLVQGNALGYTWTPGNATGNNVTIFPTTNNVTLTAMGSGSCTTTQTVNITILPIPTLSIAGNNTICAGTVLSNTVTGAQSYVWDDNSTDPTFTATPITNTTYTVIGTAANSCTNTQTVSVVVKPSPTVNAIPSQTAVCPGTGISFLATGAASYSLNGVAVAAASTATPNASMVYTLTGAGANLCENSKTVSIVVHPVPTITITPAKVLFCKGEKMKLTASGAANYTWSAPGSLTFSMQVNPTANATYTVYGTNVEGCLDEETFALIVSECVGIQELDQAASQLLVYPNPNNGAFTIKGGSDLSLNIINELGQVVRTLSIDKTNDHEVSVKDLSAGIYFIVGQKDGAPLKQKVVIQ